MPDGDVARAHRALVGALSAERLAAARATHVLFPIAGDRASDLDAARNKEALAALLGAFPDRVVPAGILARAIRLLDGEHGHSLSGRHKKVDRVRWSDGEGSMPHDIWSWARKLWRATKMRSSARSAATACCRSQLDRAC